MPRKDAPKLVLDIDGCKITVRAENKLASLSSRVRKIVSPNAIDIIQRVKCTVDGGDEFKESIPSFTKECLELYTRINKEDKETLFRTLSFLEWTDKNTLTLALSMKLKSEWSQEMNRLQVLQGAIEAGHTNSDVLQEWLDLLHKLTTLRLIPSNYSKMLSNRISKLFLQNVKADNSAASLTKL